MESIKEAKVNLTSIDEFVNQQFDQDNHEDTPFTPAFRFSSDAQKNVPSGKGYGY